MARLFVPTGFEASKVSPDLYLFLHKELSNDLYVLLEFHSGGRNRRQVDVSVLGPYGVDIVEVKAKVGGAVIASDNGPWHIQRDGSLLEEIPLNGSARENPYDQADRTAADFRQWLEADLNIYTRVFPLVVVPQYRQDSNVRNRGFVWAANGLESFKRSLRSQRPYKDVPPSLTPSHWERIVNALALAELKDLSNVSRTPEKSKEVESPDITTTEKHSLEPQSGLVPAVTVIKAAPSPSIPSLQSEYDPAVVPGRNLRPQRSLRPAALLSIVVAVLLLGLGWFALSPRPRTASLSVPVTAPPTSAPTTEATPLTRTEPPAEALPGVGYEGGDGEESARRDRVASPDGSSCPASHPVKGNINDEGERIFHVEGQAYYEVTHPEACFSSAVVAVAYGFRASLRYLA